MKIDKIGLTLCLLGTFLSASGSALYKQNCKSCHGAKGEKRAMGKSQPIHKMSTVTIEERMYAYASGKKKAMSYVLKVKKTFVQKHSKKELHDVAIYIKGLNN